MIPMMAMIPIASPALAPVDIPPLLELLDDESEEDVDAAPDTSVFDALLVAKALEVAVTKLLAEAMAVGVEKEPADEAPAEDCAKDAAVVGAGAE